MKWQLLSSCSSPAHHTSRCLLFGTSPSGPLPPTHLPSGTLRCPCAVCPSPRPLTTRGKFYWAFWGWAGTAQGSQLGWERRLGNSTGLLETRARGQGRRGWGSQSWERKPEGDRGKGSRPSGSQVARSAGRGSSNWYWAAGRGRKQRRSSKGNIQHRTGGARCCHLHKRKRAVRRRHAQWEGHRNVCE